MNDLPIMADDPDGDSDGPAGEHEGFMDKLRHTGVGTEDPNIIGDAGPTDIPPGSDPDLLGGEADPEGAPPE